MVEFGVSINLTFNERAKNISCLQSILYIDLRFRIFDVQRKLTYE